MSRKSAMSEYVSSVDKAFELVKRLSDEVNSRGGGDVDLAKLISDDQLVADVARLIVAYQPISHQTYPIVVDYTKSLEDGLALGNYDGLARVEYPHQGKAVETVIGELFRFDRSMTSDSVLFAFEIRGLRPANLAELMAFAHNFPELQRELQIVSPSLDGPNRTLWVTYLKGREIQNSLIGDWLGDSQDTNIRFLVIRKEPLGRDS